MSPVALLELIFPPVCAGCRVRGLALCSACRPQSRARAHFVRGGLTIVAAGPYEGAWRRAILNVKRGRRDLIPELGRVLCEALGAAPFDARAGLVGVPTSRMRARGRGFDQGPLLALALSRASGRTACDVLEHVAGGAQRGRSRHSRLSALHRFHCRESRLVCDAPLVLVDDVVTTGATLADCAATLRASGARVCGAVVLAYA